MADEMPFEFSFELVRSWPTLAWMAECEAGSNSIRVVHGPGIERRADWFCEAIWDAPFDEGGFDRTDLIFGSGGRSRETGVTFVSAGSVVDRLQVATHDERTFVSNSLACLLEAIDAQLDPGFRGYDAFFEEINLGIDQDLPDLPVVGGTIGFTYFHNLLWDGSRIRRTPKPASRRDFGTFEAYMAFLRAALHRTGENMSSSERARPLDWLGTISRGYDSATCAALAREAGLKRLMTHDESRPGTPDDGLAIAKALNLECVIVDRLAWKGRPSIEPLFLAGDAQGKEVMIAGAPMDLDGLVVVTGHGGGAAWGKKFKPNRLPPNPSGDIRQSLLRNWHCGLSMTEYRLHAGFIHLPLPYIGLRQRADLLELSNSAEMAPWDIGGDYSRPICRRILEEAGVPRDLFGMSKTGASIRFLRGEDAWSPSGKRSFFRWLRRHGPERGMPPVKSVEAAILLHSLELALFLSRRGPAFFRRRFRILAFRLADRLKQIGFNDLAFVWAVETTRKAYRSGRTKPCRAGEMRAGLRLTHQRDPARAGKERAVRIGLPESR